MKIRVLGIEGCKSDYTVHYDIFQDGKVVWNHKAKILKFDVVNKIIETDKGVFDVVDSEKDFYIED